MASPSSKSHNLTTTIGCPTVNASFGSIHARLCARNRRVIRPPRQDGAYGCDASDDHQHETGKPCGVTIGPVPGSGEEDASVKDRRLQSRVRNRPRQTIGPEARGPQFVPTCRVSGLNKKLTNHLPRGSPKLGAPGIRTHDRRVRNPVPCQLDSVRVMSHPTVRSGPSCFLPAHRTDIRPQVAAGTGLRFRRLIVMPNAVRTMRSPTTNGTAGWSHISKEGPPGEKPRAE